MLFATKLTGDTAGGKYMDEAYYNQIPVEGFVEKEIKGGFEVIISGHTRAFCPYSQMGVRHPEKTENYIEKHLTFRIIEYDEKNRNIVLSHKAVLEEERQKKRELLKETERQEQFSYQIDQ